MKRKVSQRALAEAQNWRCAYCGGTMRRGFKGPAVVTREHVTPRVLGGSDEADNLVAACKPCNETRGQRIEAEIFARLRAVWAESGRWAPLTEPGPAVTMELFVLIRQRERAARDDARHRLKASRRRLGKVRAALARADRQDQLDW